MQVLGSIEEINYYRTSKLIYMDTEYDKWTVTVFNFCEQSRIMKIKWVKEYYNGWQNMVL